jgi:CheY-like chemotaxis protein
MILFVDDEERRVENDIEELRICGYEVHLETTIDGAFEYWEREEHAITAVISDIMMPHGSRLTDKETRDGLRSGVALYYAVRLKRQDTPFVFFTNVSFLVALSAPDGDLRRRLEEGGDPQCHYLEKRDFLPFQFAAEVDRFLSRSAAGGGG